jgi:hypothetical protein
MDGFFFSLGFTLTVQIGCVAKTTAIPAMVPHTMDSNVPMGLLDF